MNLLILILKGIVCGMAVMIPGVSAGSMIMSMGLYEDLMMLISGKKSERKSVLPRILPFAAGLLAGIFLFAFIFKFALKAYPFQTSCVFIGLIIGGIPMIWRKVNRKKITWGNITAFLAAVAVVVVMLFLSRSTTASNSLQPSVLHFLLTIVLGFLAAATMIIPGISGSALMLILGYYHEITDRLTQLAKGFGTLNWAAIGENLLVFIPFLIGAAIGIVLVAKAIRKLLDKYPNSTYLCMIGLMAASPAAVIAKIDTDFAAIGLIGYLVSALCIALGFLVSYTLSKKD